MDAKQSMQTPPAPKLDTDGGPIMPSCAVAAVSAPNREGSSVVAQPSPLRPGIGVLGPVQGLESFGRGAVHPKSGAGTSDTAITNVRPDGPPTPGY